MLNFMRLTDFSLENKRCCKALLAIIAKYCITIKSELDGFKYCWDICTELVIIASNRKVNRKILLL